MITFLYALPVGAAVRCIVQPPATAKAWKVLRKTVNVFSGHNDPAAGVVSVDEEHFVDTFGLQNGTPYYYRSYWQDGAGAWATDDPSALTATPAATAGLIGADPLHLVRERLELGLKAAVVAGRIVHEDAYIPTFSGPPKYEDVTFPIVTVHLTNDDFRGGGSGLGELVSDDVFIADDDEWSESEGALSRVQLTIVAWVINNADLRDALRRETKAILIANLPVFSAKGLNEVSWSQTNVEDFQTYDAPMFQVITTFNCIASSAASNRVPAIATATASGEAVFSAAA